MKNNQGFSLISVMLISAILAVVAAVGMNYLNQNSNKIDAEHQKDQGNGLVSNIASAAANPGVIERTEALQFSAAPAPTTAIKEPLTPANPEPASAK